MSCHDALTSRVVLSGEDDIGVIEISLPPAWDGPPCTTTTSTRRSASWRASSRSSSATRRSPPALGAPRSRRAAPTTRSRTSPTRPPGTCSSAPPAASSGCSRGWRPARRASTGPRRRCDVPGDHDRRSDDLRVPGDDVTRDGAEPRCDGDRGREDPGAARCASRVVARTHQGASTRRRSRDRSENSRPQEPPAAPVWGCGSPGPSLVRVRAAPGRLTEGWTGCGCGPGVIEVDNPHDMRADCRTRRERAEPLSLVHDMREPGSSHAEPRDPARRPRTAGLAVATRTQRLSRRGTGTAWRPCGHPQGCTRLADS